MNNAELAKRIIDCISDGYDDEEYRVDTETKLCDELSQLNDNSTVKLSLEKLCELVEELQTECPSENKTETPSSPYTKIKDLPDGTLFYVHNGVWDGYVTTENNKKICYAGVERNNPTKDYVRRFEVNDDYELIIDILN